jgi:ribosomal protein S18 acetylase RimI-like enzyme
MNAFTNSVIRQAVTDDARHLAQLIDLAGEGIPSWLWKKSCENGQRPIDVGIERAKRQSGAFSYKNALVTERAGQLLGMVLSYAITEAPTDDPDDLPAPIAPFVALEKFSVGSWFINALAVFSAGQGRGLGTELLHAAEGLARSNGYGEMSIQAYDQNTGAVRLYKRLGYELAASEPVRLHPCPPYHTGDVLLLKKRLV